MPNYKSWNEDRGGISRRKRNVLFPSGVKLCAQETAEQAIANHLDYFHLRVCQETVWEAFKIFWDRLPERDEYQNWMTMCREGRASTLDIGTNFSKSPEHVSLVQSVSAGREEIISVLWPETSTLGLSPEVTLTGSLDVTQEVTVGGAEEAIMEVVQEVNLGAMSGITVGSQDAINKVEEDTITNEIEAENFARPARPLREQVVELSIQLKGETYSDALRDSSSPYYQRLAQQFTEKIEDAFERLPGFKSVAVLEFRPQRGSKGDSAVVVHYVVTLEVDGGITKETMDYINLQSNLVGDSYPALEERPTMVYTITDFRNYITEALHKENFIGNSTLAVDPDSLQLENVEALLPPGVSNPSNPADDNMDNALEARKLPNMPGQDLDSNDIFNSGFSKDDFLLDPIHSYNPWMGSQGLVPNPNDVIAVDESPTLPPPVFPDRTFDMNIESTPKSENITPVPNDGSE
ncbi:hypothetical protein AAFF_G00433180 [Aldrovandia affinis]|uniref:SEA domain-containing protein n=1 Tax=Aldrovandia affinis TaxID=143900 RepID=A0AAD7SAX3_9TELE|nr:hypothetical protein AAFF_G00433180 [Aldrovandia affinis]